MEFVIYTDVLSAGADFVFIPERPPDAGSWEDEMCNAVRSVGSLSVTPSVL